MPLLPKNAGTGAAALAAIMAQAKAEAAAAAIRQVAATVSAPAPKPLQRTTERNSSAYYGYSQPGGNVIVNAPPVNGGQAGEFYASPKPLQRTTDRNSSAFYGARQPATVYQPPVNGGQAGEFYTPPRTFYGPTAFGPTTYGPPVPSGQGQLTRAAVEALAAQQMNPVGYQETQRQQMIESPSRTQDRNSSAFFGVTAKPIPRTEDRNSSRFFANVPQPPPTVYGPYTLEQGKEEPPPGPPPSFNRAVQGFEQDERQFRWRERRIEELDAEIENLRKIMRDGGGNRASSEQLAQWVNEREQLLTGVYGNENTGLLNQLAEGIQEVRDFGPQDMGPLKPLGEFVEAIWDDPRVETVKQGAIWAFEHADVPRQFVTGKFGDALYLLTLTAPEAVEMLSFIPGMDDFQRFVEEANLRDEIMDWYVNGYNGFTGGRAVWEGLIGKTDELPWYLRYPIRLTTDLVMDPLSYAYLVAKVGRVGKIAGQALATLPDASRAEKVVGRTMQAMGKTTEFAGHGLDNLFVDVPVRGVRKIGRATSVGRPAAFDLSERALHTRAVTEVTGATRRMERARAAAGQRPVAASETLTVPKPPTDPGAGAQVALPEPRPGGPVTAAVPGSETWPQPREATPSAIQATPQKPKPVDRPAVVTAGGDIVDPPTGQLLPGADDVPKDLPNLRRAAARSVVPDEPRTGGGFRKKGDDFSAPRVDGTRLQDRIATGGLRALANGDTKTARLFENELARYEAKAVSELGDNPLFLNWDEGGAPIRVSSADAPFTDEELALFQTTSDGRVLNDAATLREATRSRDGGLGGALQLAHMLHFESYHLDAFRRLFPGTDLPTGANARFRINAEAPGSFRDERLYWLMEEYVTTPDPIRAQAIADVLNNPTGPLLRLAPNGKPYLTAIPSQVKRPGANMSIRSEVATLLHAARKNWDEARATIHKPDVVAQARGGLKAENKRMADAIENAIETEARLKREALQKLAAEGQGEAVVARFQWKIDPGSNWKRGAQTELRRHADGTYHVWSKPGNKRAFEDLGELGDPNSLSTDVSLNKTPDEFIANMREKGDQFNPATGERNPWAMELAPWETWNDAEVVRHGKSFDAGPSSPENLQYLGRYSPEREATPYQFQDADLAARQAAPETATPPDVTPPAAGAVPEPPRNIGDFTHDGVTLTNPRETARNSFRTNIESPDGTPVGFITYSTESGRLQVSMIEVQPPFRRQGLGSRAIVALRKMHPDHPYVASPRTEAGAAMFAGAEAKGGLPARSGTLRSRTIREAGQGYPGESVEFYKVQTIDDGSNELLSEISYTQRTVNGEVRREITGARYADQAEDVARESLANVRALYPDASSANVRALFKFGGSVDDYVPLIDAPPSVAQAVPNPKRKPKTQSVAGMTDAQTEARTYFNTLESRLRKQYDMYVRVGFNETDGYYVEITAMSAHTNNWTPPAGWVEIRDVGNAKRYRFPELIENERILMGGAAPDVTPPAAGAGTELPPRPNGSAELVETPNGPSIVFGTNYRVIPQQPTDAVNEVVMVVQRNVDGEWKTIDFHRGLKEQADQLIERAQTSLRDYVKTGTTRFRSAQGLSAPDDFVSRHSGPLGVAAPPAAGAGEPNARTSVTQQEFERIRDEWNVAYTNSERAWRQSNAVVGTPQHEQALAEWERLSEITRRLEAQMDEAERVLRESGDDFVSRHSGPLGVAAPPAAGAGTAQETIPTVDDLTGISQNGGELDLGGGVSVRAAAPRTLSMSGSGGLSRWVFEDSGIQYGEPRRIFYTHLDPKDGWHVYGPSKSGFSEVHETFSDAYTAGRKWQKDADDFVSRHSGPLGVAAPPLPGTRFFGRIRQGLDAQIQPSVIPTFDDIVNDDLRYPLELGVNEANWEDAKLLDQVLDGWQPPKKVPDKEEWRVFEAWQHVERVAAIDPTFNLGKAKFEIALRAKGIPIKKAGKQSAVDWLDRKYDGYMNIIQREHRRYGPLTGLRNIIGDTVGTMHQGIATGNIPDAFHTLVTARATHAYRARGRDPIRWAEALDDPYVIGTGQLPPAEIMPMSSRGEDPFGGFPTLNAKVAHRNKVIRGAANIWSVPYAKDYLTTVDLTSRLSHWKIKYQQFLKAEGMPRFSKLLLNTANGDPILAKQWSDLIEIEARKHAGRRWDGSFSPNDIRRALDGQTKQSNDLARAWQRETNLASQQAVKSAKSVYFSFENLNIDEYMRKVFVFHYWQTRAYPLHVRAALRNPVLLNGYYKVYEELQQIAEEQGYPSFLKDTFRFFTTKDGLAGFVSIMGVLLPTTILDAYSEKGNKFDVLINQMAPMVAGALAVAGITDRPPNATALRNDMNFIRKFTNFMIGQGYDPADLPVIGGWFEPNTLKFTVPEEAILNQLIGAANGALQRLNLGPIQAGEYTPFDRGANELDQLATWVEVVATEQFGRPMLDAQGNIQWNDEEMALFEQALDGMQTGMDSNPILNEAIERQGKEDGLGAMLNLIAPGGGVVNSQLRTDLQASAKSGDKNAGLMRDIATATDPTWVIANERYHQLGDDTSQANLKLYNTILNDLESFADQQYLIRRTGVGGDEAFIDLRPLLEMSYDERKEYLNQLFAWSGELNGIQQLQAERDAFKQANPEYADYLTYQSGVYKYEDKPGGIKAWREQLANDNPNFERAMQDQREYLEGIGKKGAVLEAELDDWATGQEAFHAAMGEQFNLYDPEPTRTYDPSNDPLQSSALSFMVPETDQGYPQTEGETDKPEKGSAEDLQQRFAENDQNFAFANRAAEELYGDSWDYDAVAQSGEPKEGWIGPGKKPDIAYWPSGSTPGDTTLQDRYAEWKRMMLAAGVPPGQLTIQDWIDWEAGLQEQYFPQQNPYPDLWQPWLEEDQRRSA